MSTEWNEENIREHMFTEVEVSEDGEIWHIKKLNGFLCDKYRPFVTAFGGVYGYMRLITKPTQRLMKPIELAGKWLDFGNDGMALIVGVDDNCVMTHSEMFGIESLNCHDYGCQGWRDTPTSELNTSFEVDE